MSWLDPWSKWFHLSICFYDNKLNMALLKLLILQKLLFEFACHKLAILVGKSLSLSLSFTYTLSSLFLSFSLIFYLSFLATLCALIRSIRSQQKKISGTTWRLFWTPLMVYILLNMLALESWCDTSQLWGALRYRRNA